MSASAYATALAMLARRELSEAQLRQRLTRRGHASDAIDEAIERLKADRSLDDTRVAGAIARSEATLRGRGTLRIRRRLQAAGIAPAVAEHAMEELLQEVDPAALLDAALQRRLRGADTITDERQFARLYRYLTTQGFESDRVLALLRARKRSHQS